MFPFPMSYYMLCEIEESKIIKTEEFNSEAELLLAYDIKQRGVKCVAVAWMEMKENNRLIWIIRDNVLEPGEDGMDILTTIHSHLFGYGDDFKDEFA